MKNSVLMTTYNGQRYILEQLHSIYNQTKKPDEVIICDDCSTDDTVDIIRSFIEKESLVNWKLIVNKENKGWQKNFIEALEYVKGDIIFFSDQDDNWYPEKIEVMSNIMKEDNRIQCLAGRFNQIDGQGNNLGEQGNMEVGKSIRKEKERGSYQKFNAITFLGCTMCISKKLASIIWKINVTNFGHDAQACRLAMLLEGMYLLDSAVIKYRMHEENTSGVVAELREGASNLEKRKQTIEANILWLKTIIKYSKEHVLLNKEKEKIVKQTVEMQKDRYLFLEERKFWRYLSLLKYWKYYSGIAMYLGDFAYAYNINGKIAPIMAKIKKY